MIQIAGLIRGIAVVNKIMRNVASGGANSKREILGGVLHALSKIKWKASLKADLGGIKRVRAAFEKTLESAMHDVIDDLVRVSSETAPHDHGVLEKSWSKDIRWQGGTIVGTVEYSVKESNASGGQANYALWTHEYDYNLGEGSLAKPGGTGMSGRHYDVGNKYLTRPLEGEKDAYKEHIKKRLRKVIK